MDKKQSIEESQGELKNLLDTVAELDRIMRDEEDDMFTYISASSLKEMLDKRIKEIREYFYEDKVRNILKSIQSMQGVNFTKLMIPLLHKWRKNNLEKSELLEFCENRARFWERFSIDSKLNNTPFPLIFRHTYKDWLKITSFVNHKFPNKLDNDYYEVCMERISKTLVFLKPRHYIRLIDGIISMDSLYNDVCSQVCSQVCSVCKTNSDIDIYKSISRHGLYPIKDFDIIVEYLNIQDQLEQYMLGFISSALRKFFEEADEVFCCINGEKIILRKEDFEGHEP